MRLADMLGYADIHLLSRIANQYECECRSHSKHELIQNILTALGRKDVFEKQIDSLKREELRFLLSFLYEQRDTFSLEELLARAKQFRFKEEDSLQEMRPEPERPEEWNPRDTISRFRQLGWLFNGHSHHTKYLFQVPGDLKTRLCELFSGKFEKQLIRVQRPGLYRDEQMLIADDILSFLRYVYQEEVPLSADGAMYKRSLTHILDGMAVKEEPVSKGGWRFGYGRKFKEYPNRFSLIYDYCYYQELIREEGDRLVVTDKGASRVLDGVKEEMPELYRFWLRLYKGPIQNLQSLAVWMDKLARNWVTASSLSRVMCQMIRPYYYDSSQSVFEQRIVRIMMHLGMLRIGEHEQEGAVLQISALGSALINGTFVKEEDRIVLP